MSNKVKIDSFKLRVPRHLVSYVDPTFSQSYQKLYIDTGMIAEEISLDKHKVEIKDGITLRIAVMLMQQGTSAEEFVIFQVNSKMLRSKYFDGITLENLPEVHEYIMQAGIVYVDYRTFANGLVSDIDFCLDFDATPEALEKANAAIYSKVTHANQRHVRRPFAQATNVGLQFNTREHATPAKPYVKIYHKGLELEFKSFDFANKYLKPSQYRDRARLEFTLKAARHKKYLGVDYKTLLDLFSTDWTIFEDATFGAIPLYLQKKTIMKEFKELSPMDNIILTYINKLIDHGHDKESLLAVVSMFDSPQTRSRMKAKLMDLLYRVDDKEKMYSNAEIMAVLRQLKLDF